MKLHLGCGELYLEGYINIDLPSEMHSVQTTSKADLHANLLELCYPANSISEIRLHHVFEHFTRPIALALLASWSSWLRPAGKLRIEVPDFGRQILAILERPEDFAASALGIRHLFGSHEASWAIHSEGYSAKTLQYILEQYGYSILELTTNEWRHTYNFEISAYKNYCLTKEDCLNITRSILSNYLLDASESRLLEVWLTMYKHQIDISWAINP